MENEASRIAEASAHAEIARKQLRQVKEYLARGRAYQDVPDQELTGLWIEGMREWARVIHPRPRASDDTEAEFMLRGQEPPWDEVKQEVDRLVAAATASYAGMNEDERHEAGADMIRTYLAERDGQH